MITPKRISALLSQIIALMLVTYNTAAGTTFENRWTYTLTSVPGVQSEDLATKAIITAGRFVGAVTVADGVDNVIIDEKGFRLSSKLQVVRLLSMLDSNLNMLRMSQGVYEKGVPSTWRYTDKRGSRPQMEFVAYPKTKQAGFFREKEPPKYFNAQGPIVDIAMMPYMFIGRSIPKTAVPLTFTDGKSTTSTTLTPKSEQIDFKNKWTKVIRFSGTASSGTLDLWVRESDGFPLKMRVGLNAKYGLVLAQEVLEQPLSLVK